MKKILVGICGIGNGHLYRQISVIKKLLENKFEIVIATTINKKENLNQVFPKIRKIYIDIPWITCSQEGINFADCLDKYEKSGIDQFQSFLVFAKNVEMLFNGKPDFIISDYEPNVAWYAYATGKTLICMAQQSKFLYLNEEMIKGYSIKEEVYRLNYFFPKFNYRFISSFFNIDIKDENVYVLPPIINSIKRKKIKNKGIVYFSPYCSDNAVFRKILDMIKEIKDIEFLIYTNLTFKEYNNIRNLKFKSFSENFKEELSNTLFIISSSGHQLISEAISANIPLYIFPLNTYEQNYNCLMVEKYNLGLKINELTTKEFYEFYNNIPTYIENMKKYKEKYWNKTWDEIFMKVINEKID